MSKVGDRMSDGTIFAGISPDTNQPMYAAPADEAKSLALGFNEAVRRAEEKIQETGKAYRLPSAAEWDVLFNNRAAIGGFVENGLSIWGAVYWSSTEGFNSKAKVQRIEDGRQFFHDVDFETAFVRLVRN